MGNACSPRSPTPPARGISRWSSTSTKSAVRPGWRIPICAAAAHLAYLLEPLLHRKFGGSHREKLAFDFDVDFKSRAIGATRASTLTIASMQFPMSIWSGKWIASTSPPSMSMNIG